MKKLLKFLGIIQDDKKNIERNYSVNYKEFSYGFPYDSSELKRLENKSYNFNPWIAGMPK